MTTYQSDIKTISSNEEMVFNILSDLNNLQKIQNLPALGDKVKNLQFDTDSFTLEVDMIGNIGFRVIDREPFKTIKFQSERAPVTMTVLIQLEQVTEQETRMKLILETELPAMIKMMVDKKLKEGINLVADGMSQALNAALL
jgi:hypothetical protein